MCTSSFDCEEDTGTSVAAAVAIVSLLFFYAFFIQASFICFSPLNKIIYDEQMNLNIVSGLCTVLRAMDL